MSPVIMYMIAFILGLFNPFTVITAVFFLVAGMVNIGLKKNIDVRVRAIKYHDGYYSNHIVMASDIEMTTLLKMQRMFAAILGSVAFIATTITCVIVAGKIEAINLLSSSVGEWISRNYTLFFVLGIGVYLICNVLNFLAVYKIYKSNRELGEEMEQYAVTKPRFSNRVY